MNNLREEYEKSSGRTVDALMKALSKSQEVFSNQWTTE